MNDVEARLTAHLRDRAAQAESIDRFDDVVNDQPTLRVSEQRNSRWSGKARVAAAAALVLTVGGLGLVLRERRDDTAPPAAAAEQFVPAVDWSSGQVRFTASALTIDVGGRNFAGLDADVGVHSDPGDEAYQTLELEWIEHDVEMRLSFYFASDGVEWWASEMRTYDGNADGEWVTFLGEFFRTPLGTPYVGTIDERATENGVTSRLLVNDVVLEPFTDVAVLPATSRADGTPPPMPAELPTQGAAWTRHGNLTVGLAEQTLWQECMADAGFVYPGVDVEAVALASGAWEPHVVLGIGSVQSAESFGYHFDETVASGVDDFARTLSSTDRAAFYETLTGGDDVEPVPVTLPDGTGTDTTVSRGGCMGEADLVFDNLLVDQEGLRQVIEEGGVDDEQVLSDTERDPRIVTALADWRTCVQEAFDTVADTPDDLARQFAFQPETTDQEIRVAVVDAQCQADVDMQNQWAMVYAEHLRLALGDDADLFDRLALMRVEIVGIADGVLADRDIVIP